MARTPFRFASLQRAYRLASLSARRGPDTPPLDELVELAYSRRRFLQQSAAVSADRAGRLRQPAGEPGGRVAAARPRPPRVRPRRASPSSAPAWPG